MFNNLKIFQYVYMHLVKAKESTLFYIKNIKYICDLDKFEMSFSTSSITSIHSKTKPRYENL